MAKELTAFVRARDGKYIANRMLDGGRPLPLGEVYLDETGEWFWAQLNGRPVRAGELRAIANFLDDLNTPEAPQGDKE